MRPGIARPFAGLVGREARCHIDSDAGVNALVCTFNQVQKPGFQRWAGHYLGRYLSRYLGHSLGSHVDVNADLRPPRAFFRHAVAGLP